MAHNTNQLPIILKRYLFITFILTIFSSSIFAANDSIQSDIATNEIITSADSLTIQKPERLAIYDSIFSVNNGDSLILVEIIQDVRIEQLLQNKINNTLNKATSIIQGFRIQVFSSNSQKTAKWRALDMKEKMTNAFPGVPVYIVYQSPFWKVRMGDFKEQGEAQLLRTDVVEKFPSLHGDVYIVKEYIEIAQ